MATPRAGDNRVAQTQMDGRHVHNKHPPGAHFSFVKWATALWRWMGKHAVIWQRNLLLGLLGSRAAARRGSKAYVHQLDMDQDHGRLA